MIKNPKTRCLDCKLLYWSKHTCQRRKKVEVVIPSARDLDKEAFETLAQLQKAASALVADAFVTGRLLGNRERARLERK